MKRWEVMLQPPGTTEKSSPGFPPDISLSTGSTSMKYASNDATPKKIPQIIPRIAMNPQGRDAMAGVPDVPVSP